jgi:hypothetical protein
MTCACLLHCMQKVRFTDEYLQIFFMKKTMDQISIWCDKLTDQIESRGGPK